MYGDSEHHILSSAASKMKFLSVCLNILHTVFQEVLDLVSFTGTTQYK